MGRSLLQTKKALITGASSGIGKALAILFAKNGYDCILIARREEGLKNTLEIISEFSENSFYIVSDLMNTNSIEHISSFISKKVNVLDLVVLNAGKSLSTKENPDAYSQLVVLNFVRNMELIQALNPFIPQGGHIVGISSLASFTAATYAGAYSASKAAFNKGLESLRREYARDKITISIICPGFIKTELTSVNNYTMPFLMEVEYAAKKILKAIKKRKKVYCFPWQLSLILKVGLLLPLFVQDYLLSSTPHDKSDSPQRNWNEIDLNKL